MPRAAPDQGWTSRKGLQVHQAFSRTFCWGNLFHFHQAGKGKARTPSELQTELACPGPGSRPIFKGFKYFRRLKLILINYLFLVLLQQS